MCRALQVTADNQAELVAWAPFHITFLPLPLPTHDRDWSRPVFRQPDGWQVVLDVGDWVVEGLGGPLDMYVIRKAKFDLLWEVQS